MSKYTEGPWEWNIKEEGTECLRSVKKDNFGDNKRILSYYYDTGDFFLPDYADRKLIETAPELLEGLKEIEEISKELYESTVYGGGYKEILMKTQELIKKAEVDTE
ncbi:MAG: hypothetical protein ACQEQD_04555 [Bacillota bacterium]